MTGHRRILLVAYAGKGHINPALRFGKHLLKFDVEVTVCTSLSVVQRIDKDKIPRGLTFAPFSDGHDNGIQLNTNIEQFISDFETHGARAVTDLLIRSAGTTKPFDHLVYTTVIPWAARVAYSHGVKATLLWCQPATVLDIYYYYFNEYHSLISSNNKNPMCEIDLPGLPKLTMADLPSFLLASSPKEHEYILEQIMKDHIDVLKIAHPTILVNSFSELEAEPLRAIKKLEYIPIGPLLASESENSTSRDFFDAIDQDDYIQWLNTQSKSSVVFVSFGTLATLSMDQQEEIANGLLECGLPFLWVIRGSEQARRLSKLDELKKQGMIVGWCSQVEVLSHQAIGCFVMHCGWNSTVESLAAGVRVVVFPQWSDQPTNSKMIESVWKTGVRVRRRDKDGVMEGKELKRCVEIVMGSDEMKRNAEKWKELSREALNDGALNLQSFLDNA